MREARVAATTLVLTVAVMLLFGMVGKDAAMVQPAAAGAGLEFNPKLNAYVTTLGDGLIVWHVEGSKIGKATQYYIGQVIVKQDTKAKTEGKKEVAVFDEKPGRFLFAEEYGAAPSSDKYSGEPKRMRDWVPPMPDAPAPAAGGASCGGGGGSCG